MNNNNLELRTERLTLRPVTTTDADAILAYRSDAVTNKYQGWIPETIEEVIDFINNKVSSTINIADSWFQFVIITSDDNLVIGDLGVHFIDEEGFQAEIGCTLRKDQQGKGYATESLSTLIDYLFQSLDKHRIVASIDPRNLSSIKMLERLKFRKEAHFKKSLLINGEWVDDMVYAILGEEWVNEKSD